MVERGLISIVKPQGPPLPSEKDSKCIMITLDKFKELMKYNFLCMYIRKEAFRIKILNVENTGSDRNRCT